MRKGISRRALWAIVTGLLGAVSLGGCGDSSSEDDGSGGSAPVTRHDAGTGGGGRGGAGGTGGSPGDDGGADDDGGIGEPVFGECDFNDPVPPDGASEPEGTGVSLPTDLSVERVLTTWEGDCRHPVLRIELSEGRCPNGTGHGVTFLLDAKRIEDGTIQTGQNVIGPDSNGHGISLRYVRTRREPPIGEWGNCGAPASGFLNFFGDLSLEAGAELVANFTLVMMPDCTTLKNDPVDMNGGFRVTLQRGLKDVCP